MKLFPKSPKSGYQVDAGFSDNSGMHYLDVIDRLETELSVDLYLEIGSRSGASIARRTCSFIAIDPEFAVTAPVFNSAELMLFFQQTSDAFFASGVLEALDQKPDLAFIDGMHLFEYALRDFIHCERSMGENGVVCFHDVAPFNHAMTTRDITYLNGSGMPWTGDVWKVMVALKEYRPDLTVELLSAQKTGLGVVSGLAPDNTVLADKLDTIVAKYTDITLKEFGVTAYFDQFPIKHPEELSLFKP